MKLHSTLLRNANIQDAGEWRCPFENSEYMYSCTFLHSFRMPRENSQIGLRATIPKRDGFEFCSHAQKFANYCCYCDRDDIEKPPNKCVWKAAVVDPADKEMKKMQRTNKV